MDENENRINESEENKSTAEPIEMTEETSPAVEVPPEPTVVPQSPPQKSKKKPLTKIIVLGASAVAVVAILIVGCFAFGTNTYKTALKNAYSQVTAESAEEYVEAMIKSFNELGKPEIEKFANILLQSEDLDFNSSYSSRRYLRNKYGTHYQISMKITDKSKVMTSELEDKLSPVKWTPVI